MNLALNSHFIKSMSRSDLKIAVKEGKLLQKLPLLMTKRQACKTCVGLQWTCEVCAGVLPLLPFHLHLDDIQCVRLAVSPGSDWCRLVLQQTLVYISRLRRRGDSTETDQGWLAGRDREKIFQNYLENISEQHRKYFRTT